MINQKNALFSKVSYIFAILIVATCTSINFGIYHYVDSSNLIMVYLLVVVIVAALQDKKRMPAIMAAIFATLTIV